MVAPGTGPGSRPSLFDRRSMVDWARHITVPVFLSGALQDEQTGPQWPALIDAFPKTTPVFANMVNGGHIDSTDPQTISRWLEFLDIYVAGKVPDQSRTARRPCSWTSSPASPPAVSSQAPLPAIRFTQAAELAVGPGRVRGPDPRWSGSSSTTAPGPPGPGAIESTYAADFSTWPPAGSVRTLSFGAQRIARVAPGTGSSTSFTLDPSGSAADQPARQWERVGGRPGLGLDAGAGRRRRRLPDRPVHDGHHHRGSGHARPLGQGIGAGRGLPGHHHRSAALAAQEEYVTSGFLRSTNQVDNPDSTALFTDPTYSADDAKDLSSTLVLVGAGSRSTPSSTPSGPAPNCGS